MTLPESKQILAPLIAKFSDNLPAYKSANYNETQLRREFLDPMIIPYTYYKGTLDNNTKF
ncbi:hypothetical protein AGMMS49938_18350 [Fibrobacterales bacterium]|nr:hypothetical protein AGMMS49938_18350 [Fibrobacterales bacterium]